jgi:hypothetical protein
MPTSAARSETKQTLHPTIPIPFSVANQSTRAAVFVIFSFSRLLCKSRGRKRLIPAPRIYECGG